MKFIIVLLFAYFSILICFPSNVIAEEKNQYKKYVSIKDVPDILWQKLSKQNILFGHQSIGDEIIQGIQDIIKIHSQIQLNILEINALSDLKEDGFFAHIKIGKNKDPISKVDHFAEIIRKKQLELDIIFLKFCYVDLYEKKLADELFDYYKTTFSLIKEEYPNINILHFTVPLTYNKETIKTYIKKKIGKEFIWEYQSNIVKNEYNYNLRLLYSEGGYLFDIAYYESLLENGDRSVFYLKNKQYYQLAKSYTYDDGHLNEKGRKIIAENLLLKLISIIN